MIRRHRNSIRRLAPWRRKTRPSAHSLARPQPSRAPGRLSERWVWWSVSSLGEKRTRNHESPRRRPSWHRADRPRGQPRPRRARSWRLYRVRSAGERNSRTTPDIHRGHLLRGGSTGDTLNPRDEFVRATNAEWTRGGLHFGPPRNHGDVGPD